MRVRKLVFNDENKDNFVLLYQGFVTGGNSSERKGIETSRREAQILDKLEAVSDEEGGGICDACRQPNPVRRELREGEHVVTLDQPQFDLLKRYFESTPWTVRVSRRVVEIADWLADIPVEKE